VQDTVLMMVMTLLNLLPSLPLAAVKLGYSSSPVIAAVLTLLLTSEKTDQPIT